MERYDRYKDSGIEWIGEIPEHWDVVRLKYGFEIIMGQSPNSEFCNRKANGIPFLQGNADFKDKYPVASTWCSEPSKVAPAGSVLISVRAPIGEVNLADVEYCIGRGLCAIVSQNKEYLYYLLTCLSAELKSLGTGSTFKAVSVEQISNTYYCQPPLPEQTTIANYLDRMTAEIDALIAKKKRLLELYEEEKTAIINHAVTKGINPDAPMKDSGIQWLGEVPAHWEVKKLKYIVDMKSGNNITSDRIKESGDYPVYGGNGIRGYYNEHTHEGLHVLIGRQGALCGNINYAVGKFWASEHAVVCTAEVEHNVFWFGELLKTMNLNQYSVSAAQPGLSVEKIKNLDAPFPSVQEQNEIASFLDVKLNIYDTKVDKVKNLVKLLSEYRTALISEVVTGKVKVTE